MKYAAVWMQSFGRPQDKLIFAVAAYSLALIAYAVTECVAV